MHLKFSQSFKIDEHPVGSNNPVFIIAEAGVAHFGSMEKAMRLVDLAADSGADAVKFQIYKTEALISTAAKEWQNRYRHKELAYGGFRKIQAYCQKKGIAFLATAHDEPSLEFLDSLDVTAYKIGSGEVGNWAFIKRTASRKKPVIVSTGMYTLEEVGKALEAISETGNKDVVVLHCVTQYPTPPTEVNLNAMDTIREAYGVMVGYSDHTQGFHFPLAAAALGARVIEKHISLDFNVPNAQDWKVSCGPEDFPVLVRQIRDIEAGLGSGIKRPSQAEQSSLNWARKSLVAAVDIAKGEVITPEKLCVKRPGFGIMPADIVKVAGREAKVNIEKDTLIKWEQLK